MKLPNGICHSLGVLVLCLALVQVSSWPTALLFRGSRIGYGRNIRPLHCSVKARGGICMFAWDCMKASGTHLGTCIDRFYFGSCCVMKAVKLNHHENEIDNNILSSPSDDRFGIVPIKNSMDPIKPSTVLMKPLIVPIKSSIVQIKPSVAQVEPSIVPIKPSIVLIEPNVVSIESSTTLIKPSIVSIEPSPFPIEPSVVSFESSIVPIEPSIGVVEPSIFLIDPSIDSVESSTVSMNPSIVPVKSSVLPIEPEVAHVKPAVVHVKPSIDHLEPAIVHIDPSVVQESIVEPSSGSLEVESLATQDLISISEHTDLSAQSDPNVIMENQSEFEKTMIETQEEPQLETIAEGSSTFGKPMDDIEPSVGVVDISNIEFDGSEILSETEATGEESIYVTEESVSDGEKLESPVDGLQVAINGFESTVVEPELTIGESGSADAAVHLVVNESKPIVGESEPALFESEPVVGVESEPPEYAISGSEPAVTSQQVVKDTETVGETESTVVESELVVEKLETAVEKLETAVDVDELIDDHSEQIAVESELTIGGSEPSINEAELTTGESESIISGSESAVDDLSMNINDLEIGTTDVEATKIESSDSGTSELIKISDTLIPDTLIPDTETPELGTTDTAISETFSSETISSNSDYGIMETDTETLTMETDNLSDSEHAITEGEFVTSESESTTSVSIDSQIKFGISDLTSSEVSTIIPIEQPLQPETEVIDISEPINDSNLVGSIDDEGSFINAIIPVHVDSITNEVNEVASETGIEEPANEILVTDSTTYDMDIIVTIPNEISDEESIVEQSFITSKPLENVPVIHIITENELTTERVTVADNKIKHGTTHPLVDEVTVEAIRESINMTKEHPIITKKPMVTLTFPEVITAPTTSGPINKTKPSFGIGNLDFKKQEQLVVQALKKANYDDICGAPVYPTGRIVGGLKASYGEWPWQVSLRQWRSVAFLHKCGAAIVNENWAITASHCVEGIEPDQLLVVMGEYDLGNSDEPYPHVERSIQVIAMHPKFEPRTFEYDLALLRFSEPVEFQPNIIPICIPNDDYDFINETGVVTGWGRLYEDGPLPTVMQNVLVPIILNGDCEEMYKNAGYVEHIPNIFICAGYQAGKQDSCEGDSGGPMVIKRKNRWRLAGVISWGIGCAVANQPGVYTRISEFKEWINKIIVF